jgi:hypothetical protein
MSGFPPAKGNSSHVQNPNGNPNQMNSTPTSTGNGGIKASLKVKAAGIVPSPGVEKNVNLS